MTAEKDAYCICPVSPVASDPDGPRLGCKADHGIRQDPFVLLARARGLVKHAISCALAGDEGFEAIDIERLLAEIDALLATRGGA